MKHSICFLVLSAVVAISAERALAADYFKSEQPRAKGFVANGFWDNWEIQGGVGPTFNIGTGSGASDAMRVGGFVGVGKWIHPIFGVRMVGEGGQFRQRMPSGRASNWSYLFFHPDIMLDLTNWVGGYKPDRFWNMIVFLGGGVGSSALNSPKRRTVQFVGDAGVQSRFRASNAVSVDVTLQYMLADADFRPSPAIKSNRFHGLGLFVGTTYRFNKRTFERSAISEADAKAMLDNVRRSAERAQEAQAAAQAAQAEANKQIKRAKLAGDEVRRLEAENAALRDKLQKKSTPAAPSARTADKSTADVKIDGKDCIGLLLYECGYSALTADHKARLNNIAEHIKSTDEKVFCIDGFADKATGSPQANERLARKRARIVADYLIGRGVEPARLNVGCCGTASCNMGDAAHNRVVAIY